MQRGSPQSAAIPFCTVVSGEKPVEFQKEIREDEAVRMAGAVPAHQRHNIQHKIGGDVLSFRLTEWTYA